LDINRLVGGVVADNQIINCGDTTTPFSFPAAISFGNVEHIDIHDNVILNCKSSGIGVTGSPDIFLQTLISTIIM
jgi:hypothetical protein